MKTKHVACALLLLLLGVPLPLHAADWELMHAGPGSVNGLWGSAPDDVFAVGGWGTILHRDVSGWKAMPSGTDAELTAVWGAAAQDVYAGGTNGMILHYDGSAWAAEQTALPYDTVAGIWGSGTDDVFAVTSNGQVLHREAAGWVSMPKPDMATFSGIWGSGPGDVFAVGGHAALHFDGVAWSRVLTGSSSLLAAVWGSASDDVFAVGQGGAILHYDGEAWSPMTSGSTHDLQAVFGCASNDVYALGSRTLLHYDGAAWSPASTGFSAHFSSGWCGGVGGASIGTGSPAAILQGSGSSWEVELDFPDLLSVWGSSPWDVFAVGTRGAIWHYDGSAWARTSVPLDPSRTLRRVWGRNPYDVYAVGDAGTILHYDGSEWSAMSSGTTRRLAGLWGFSARNVYAVGEGGTILHFNGSAWTPVPSSTSRNINAIWGPSPRDLFAAADRGLALRSNGSVWWNFIIFNPACTLWGFRDVWGTSAENVYFVGDEGKILRYPGDMPILMDSGTTDSIVGIWGSRGRNIYAVDRWGILHSDGKRWASQRSPPGGGWLAGVWGSSAGDVFVVGDNAAILHRGSLVPRPPPLAVTSPNGGQRWRRGTSRLVTWDGAAGAGRVTIKLFRGSAPRAVLSKRAPDTGVFRWRIPAELPRGGRYRIQVIRTWDPQDVDASDADFRLR